jgi:hypothetical protein
VLPVIGWLRCAVARLSPRARAIAVVVLLFGAAVLALAPTHQVSDRARRPPTRATTRTRRDAPAPPSPVSAAQLARARRVARTFFAGYLPFAYGRASAASVQAATPAVRRRLKRERVQVTPVERRRRPRVVTLTALGRASGVVIVTALVDDGGIANYAVRLTLRRTNRGWLVSRVDGG